MKKVMELICFVSCVMMPSERDTDLFIFHKTPGDTRKSVCDGKQMGCSRRNQPSGSCHPTPDALLAPCHPAERTGLLLHPEERRMSRNESVQRQPGRMTARADHCVPCEQARPGHGRDPNQPPGTGQTLRNDFGG
ncbi:hypothetical protein MHYP_G00272930 [Metynnis hypsauchen]